jgi:hypothetical protein
VLYQAYEPTDSVEEPKILSQVELSDFLIY